MPCKNSHIHIKLLTEQKEKLRKKAEENGENLSEFVIRRCLKDLDLEEILKQYFTKIEKDLKEMQEKWEEQEKTQEQILKALKNLRINVSQQSQ